MRTSDVWEPVAVKNQIIKTAIEASAMLLRIDDVVSGVKKREKESRGGVQQPEEPMETFGDARDGWFNTWEDKIITYLNNLSLNTKFYKS